MGAARIDQTDETLMGRVREDDREAFLELVRRHQGGVYGFLWRMCRHVQEAEDLAQETFLSVWKARATWAPGGAFRPWVFRIARNVLAQALRARRPAAPAEERHATSPSADLEREELIAIVRSCVDDLPAELREVLLLRQNEGFTLQEISSVLGSPLGTVKTRYLAGLARLRGMLRERFHGDLDDLFRCPSGDAHRPRAGRD